MVQVREVIRRERFFSMVPIYDLWIAREEARRGDLDDALPVVRQAVDKMHEDGQLGFGIWASGVLVETLAERCTENDLTEAQSAIDRLASLPTDEGSAIVNITVLQLRALLARARSDEVAYRELVGRYRAMAESLEFEGYIAMAEAML